MKTPVFVKKLLRPPAVFLLAGLLVLGSGLLLGYALFRAGGPNFSAVKLPKLPSAKQLGSKLKRFTLKAGSKKTTAKATATITAKAAAAPAPARIEPEPPPPPPPDYCLQLGAFTDLKKAQQLQASLKDRGYAPIIFEGIDSGYKAWHAVRISKYPDIDSATKAAADFTAKERLQAIVRPSDEL